MERRRIIVNDRMQRGYGYWLTSPMGEDFASDFTPHLTPPALLRLGVFGGKYMTDCRDEFPASWFDGVRFSVVSPQASYNFFGVLASQPLSVWRAKGWICEDDPRGWFQWYCRYYYGRRHEDDRRQIMRWRLVRRHVAQLTRHCKTGDWSCRPRQRQALLHWAYDSRVL
ncbi:MAG: hypothetical protein GDA54_06175 [Alphaproteobacteria bacterium GM7ARS4]|nr:hypothetical protein [Alphaproteobacteria bacterium GM7ARS4]